MRKHYLTLGLLSTALLFSVSSCTSPTSGDSAKVTDTVESDTSHNSSDGEDVVITGVEIAGPTAVKIGESIYLDASVSGDDDNEVTWESLTPTVATVDADGKVTGLSAGAAQIKATSAKDVSKSAVWEVNVVASTQTPTEVLPYIDEDEASYDADTGVYSVEVYSTFQVKYNLDVTNPTAPAGDVVYELMAGENGESYSSYVSVDRSTGACEVLMPLADTVLTIRVSYPTSQSGQAVYGYLRIRIVDTNQDTIDEYAAKLDTALELEATKVTEATVVRNTKSITTQVDDEGETTTSTAYSRKKIDYHYFNDAVYTEISQPKSDMSGESLEKTSAYSGILSDKFYNFTYKNNYGSFSAQDVYVKGGDKATYAQNANLPFNYDDGSTYGLVNNVRHMLTESDYLGAPAVNNANAKRNMVVKTANNVIGISSVFESQGVSSESTNSLSLTMSFTSEGALSSYSFSSIVYNEDNEIVDSVFESAEFTFGTKTDDSAYSGKVNLDSFLVKYYLSLSNAFGEKNDQYDFTNPEKYVSASLGNYGYSAAMFPNQSLAIRVTGDGTLISLDEITATVTPVSYTVVGNAGEEDVTPETPLPVCTVTSYDNGIFVINNAFTNAGNYVIGESQITFTSSKGISTTLTVSFSKLGVPTAISVDYGSTSFGEIFVGDESDYFYLNGTPDNPEGYNFALVDVIDTTTSSPATDALELTRSTDITVGTTGYVIKGLKAGTYSFKFGFEDYPDIKSSSTYTITVLEPRTEQDFIDNVFDSVYTAGTTTMSVKVEFSADGKTMTITQTNGEVVYVDTLNIEFRDGKIYVLGGTAVDGIPEGTYVSIGHNPITEVPEGHNEPSYGYIRTDTPITASIDYNTLSMTVVAYGNTVTQSTDLLKDVNPFVGLNFNTAYLSDSTTHETKGIGVSFNEDGTGEFRIYADDMTTLLETISFKYTYTTSYKDQYSGNYNVTITDLSSDLDEGSVLEGWSSEITGYLTTSSYGSPSLSLTLNPANYTYVNFY